ncbi:diaminopimelate epimerase [Gilvimarinus sp. F26214L]|uniref:diaminopimelate epimerase n=1 Tax=Gilvimarinus sp. DZF01 TaxID=3461371 RepID=UPI0040455146
MRLRFTKMHGCGNDFVMIDGVTQHVKLTPDKVRFLADRRFGVGCDQLLVVEAPTHPDMDFRYRIFNSDGSEVENCGNGARCFAKFVRDRRLTAKRVIHVETMKGSMTLEVQRDGQVTVNMGVPVLDPGQIPFVADGQSETYSLDLENAAGPEPVDVSAVSMGNPHGVLVVPAVAEAPVQDLGSRIQQHPRFPEGVNVGFMAVLSRAEIDLRVLERGVGETLACGTGACAAVVAGRLRGLLDEHVTVNLPGGRLGIRWAGEGEPVIMTGPATTVYQGQIHI